MAKVSLHEKFFGQNSALVSIDKGVSEEELVSLTVDFREGIRAGIHS